MDRWQYPDLKEHARLPRTIVVAGVRRYTARMSDAGLYAAGYKRIVDVTTPTEGMQRASAFVDVDTGERIERTYDAEAIPAPDLAAIFATKQAEIKALAEAILEPYAREYPMSERETWATQESEARALLTGQITEAEAVSIAALVAGRAAVGGTVLSVTQQAQRIVANADAWRAAGVSVAGQRNGYHDQLTAAHAAGDVAAILAINPAYTLPGA